MRLPASKDSRFLLAGVAAFAALVVYLAVAFVNTHASSGTSLSLASKVAPWTPQSSTLVPIPRRGGGFSVRVVPTRGPALGGSYGAVAQTLVQYPTAGERFVVSLALKGAGSSRIGVEVDEFRPGVTHYLVETTVPATDRWHTFKFRGRVKGQWLGLAMYVYRASNVAARRPFAIRQVTVLFRRH